MWHLRNTIVLFGFYSIKYDKLGGEDMEKVEEEVIDMMVNFKYTPIELGKLTWEELYNEIDNKGKHSLTYKWFESYGIPKLGYSKYLK